MRNIFIIILSLFLVACGKKTEKTTVLQRDLKEMIFASGTLEAEDKYNLTAEVAGYIVDLNYEEGDKVKKGEIFAVIENRQNDINTKSNKKLLDLAKKNTLPSAPQLRQIAANIKAAEEKVVYDEKQETRYKKLLQENSIAVVEYENVALALKNSEATLQALQEQYDNLKLQSEQQLTIQQQQYDLSTIDNGQTKLKVIVPGKVYSLKKQKGDYVRKGDVIASIANPKEIYANLSVDESNMGKIRLGQETFIQLNTNKEKQYRAKIVKTQPTFDEQAQSFFIKALFKDSLDFRIPGTQLEANILVGTIKNALVIPTNYLGYGNQVLLPNDSLILVEPGIISSDWVEIKNGLSAGATIKRELTE